MPFQLFSTSFAEGGWIPDLHTCQGADISPSLEWSGEPLETRSFVLILDDPDAPAGTWNHWLLFDIPPKIHNLAQGYRPGKLAVSGNNDFGKRGYGGPCPPKGHGPHRYFFTLSALDVATLTLPAETSRKAVEQAMKGHVIGQARLIGRYERK